MAWFPITAEKPFSEGTNIVRLSVVVDMNFMAGAIDYVHHNDLPGGAAQYILLSEWLGAACTISLFLLLAAELPQKRWQPVPPLSSYPPIVTVEPFNDLLRSDSMVGSRTPRRLSTGCYPVYPLAM